MTSSPELRRIGARIASGALAGLAATVPMTATLAVLFRRLPLRQKYSPPPHQVAMEIAETMGAKPEMDSGDRAKWTALSHFGYGAAMGALYGSGADRAPLPPAVRGMAFGTLVWGGSYLGWLPAAGFRAAAEHQSWRRNGMMLAAHLVWGAALGLLDDRLGSGRPSTTPEPRRPNRRELPSRLAEKRGRGSQNARGARNAAVTATEKPGGLDHDSIDCRTRSDEHV